MEKIAFEPCPELCTIFPLVGLRKTEGVVFDTIPTNMLTMVTGGERVMHEKGAQSPNPVGEEHRPWYCHKCQDDHLLVLFGEREVDLYHPSCKEVFTFGVSSHQVTCNGELLYDGGAIIRWKAGVYHRIVSSPELGSASINFAKRYEGFDIRHEFDIWALDPATGKSKVIRDGYLDQV